jgi:hypothetical protein
MVCRTALLQLVIVVCRMHLGVYILSRILYYFSNIVVLNPSQIKHNNITGIIYDYKLL